MWLLLHNVAMSIDCMCWVNWYPVMQTTETWVAWRLDPLHAPPSRITDRINRSSRIVNWNACLWKHLNARNRRTQQEMEGYSVSSRISYQNHEQSNWYLASPDGSSLPKLRQHKTSNWKCCLNSTMRWLMRRRTGWWTWASWHNQGKDWHHHQ